MMSHAFHRTPQRRPTARILVADDDDAVRTVIGKLLVLAGYEIVYAASGTEALAIAQQASDLDLLVLDIQMPGYDGIEVTRRVRSSAATALLPIILVTGQTALEDKVAGLDAGATDFLSKPFDAPELLARIRSLLRTKAAFDSLESTQGVMVALANAVEAKDPATGHHCDRLAALAMRLARTVGLDSVMIEAVGYGAALHDVGKIGVPEAILQKSGPLVEAEWNEIRRHPAIGARIVQPLRLGPLVAPIVLGHHERWDGSGYPQGLCRDEIPLGARVITIVDAFDAMTHDRPYRKKMSVERAIGELKRMADRQFDPELVVAFVDQLSAVPVVRRPVDDALFTAGLFRSAGAA